MWRIARANIHHRAGRYFSVSGSRGEGRKQALVKKEDVDAQVQQEARPGPCFWRIVLSGGAQAFSSLPSLFFKADELAPLGEGKEPVSVNIAFADENGVEILTIDIDVTQQPIVTVPRLPGAILFQPLFGNGDGFCPKPQG